MYVVRKKFPDVYEVTNFTDRKEPDAVYTVRRNKCSCPAAWGKRSCKHLAVVNRFKTLNGGTWLFEIFDNEVYATRVTAFE